MRCCASLAMVYGLRYPTYVPYQREPPFLPLLHALLLSNFLVELPLELVGGELVGRRKLV